MTCNITIDGRQLTVPEGLSVRKAALKNGIYIPGICGHPDLQPASSVQWKASVFRGEEEITGAHTETIAGEIGSCSLCVVKVEGMDGLPRACETTVSEGMVVQTLDEEIKSSRKRSLKKILAHHPHSCLTCAQREGCSLTQCSSNVPEEERCCILLNRCELGKIVEFIGLPDSTPKYAFENFPKLFGDPFFDRDYNLCIGCLRCIRICSDVRGVDALGATFKDDRIWVGTTNSGALSESYCRFCGACVEVCPTGALQDKPDTHPVHAGEQPPCVDACPAGIDIPAYVRRIAEQDYAGAYKVIYDSVPFPGVLGYVCFHPCESACKRDTLDDSLSICALKRFVYENAPRSEIRQPEIGEATGKKVAVIGSGPAGLTSAFYLQRAGHQVDMFEASAKPGGMLRYAIPGYRLPEAVLDDELQVFSDLGVKFHAGQKLGVDFTVQKLLDEGYDTVLLTIGVGKSKNLSIPGSDLPSVIPALELLRSAKSTKPSKLSGKVVAIGGGNVAIDAAMTSLRLGADEVSMVCLEQRHEMPAHTWELQQATEEGVKVHPGWGPKEFVGDNGELQKIIFKFCTRVFDETGKFSPLYNEDETMEIAANYVIVAIGQEVDPASLEKASEHLFGMDGSIKIDKNTLATNLPGVFAAGDLINGPSSVIDAIAEGKKAVVSIDKYLGGKGISFEHKKDEMSENPYLGRDENFHHYPAVKPQSLAPDKRSVSFEVIELAYNPDQAVAEAIRCLRCNLRASITPVFLPPDKWQPLTWDNIEIVPHTEGVFQLAGIDKKVTKIVGTADIRAGLEEEAAKAGENVLFYWEPDMMYSKRESELLQKHLQQYGEMPGGGGDDDLDDLF